MAYSLVAHRKDGSTNTNGFTSGSFNATGSDLHTYSLTQDSGVGGVITDSQGNTFQTSITSGPGYANIDAEIWWVKSPSVSSSMTYSVSGSGNYPAAAVACWSGSNTSAPLDASAGNVSLFAGTIKPGSVTPSMNGCLLVSAFGSIFSDGTPPSVDSGFTLLEFTPTASAQCQDNGLAYLIQGTAGAIDLQWTSQALAQMSAIAVFKPAAGGGGASYTLTAAQGSYALTGQAAGLGAGHKMVAGQGVYSLSGQIAGLKVGRNVVATQGSYALTGQNARLAAARTMAAALGTYALTGQSAVLRVGRQIAAAQGAYSLTGQAAAFARTRALAAAYGSYVLLGQDAVLAYSAAPPSLGSLFPVIVRRRRR